MKGQNGITLVALVITVIVMLILAGVAISVLTSDGGLFTNTKNAAEKYNEATQNENQLLTNYITDINAELQNF